jgi:hypothetical protein
MGRADPPPDNEVVERAIARVLAAEDAARAEIAQAGQEALAMGERARTAVRAIEERTERRIGQVRERFERRNAAEVAALDASAAALAPRYQLDPADLKQLERAVAQLAAELAGIPR